MSSSQDSPVAKALSTDVVLLYIFQHLGVKDLLDCRLVNQTWHAIASEALFPHRVFIDHERLRYPEGNFDNYATGREEKQAYSDNLAFLAGRFLQNPNFRFLGFSIGPTASRSEMRAICLEFGQRCGKLIRQLKIKDVYEGYRLPEVFASFSEIEHLVVGGSIEKPARGDENRYLRLNGNDIRLPRLRSIRIIDPHKTWSGFRQLFEELMEASAELKEIDCFHVCFTEAAIKCSKLNTVSSLNLTYPDVGSYDLPNVKAFSVNTPSLKSFSCLGFFRWAQDNYSRYGNQQRRHFLDSTLGSVNRILTASKDTLKDLRIDYFCKPLEFTKLTSLHIVDRTSKDDEEAEPYRVFPREWDFAPRSYFPALKTVRLELKHLRGDSVKVFFGDGDDDKFPTVTTLELACPFDNVGIEGLSATFPNVKTLRVFWDKCKYSYLPDLWSFSSTLKGLEILNFGDDWSDFNDFDVSITGFYEGVCEKLRKRHRVRCDPDDLEAFRIYPTIVNLTGLERLSVHFIEGEHWERRVDDAAVSPISQWYAFGLMPKLKTQFVYDFKGKHAGVLAKVLEPYRSYVSIRSK